MEAAQELEDVSAGGAAENSIFVLQANQIDITEVKEICRLAVRNELVLESSKRTRAE